MRGTPVLWEQNRPYYFRFANTDPLQWKNRLEKCVKLLDAFLQPGSSALHRVFPPVSSLGFYYVLMFQKNVTNTED
jgi:hypothetical protein